MCAFLSWLYSKFNCIFPLKNCQHLPEYSQGPGLLSFGFLKHLQQLLPNIWAAFSVIKLLLLQELSDGVRLTTCRIRIINLVISHSNVRPYIKVMMYGDTDRRGRGLKSRISSFWSTTSSSSWSSFQEFGNTPHVN